MVGKSLLELLPFWVARVPATVHTKLITGFLAIVGLLIIVGVAGLQVLGEVNRRTEDTVKLHRKISAYRKLQHGTTAQLYNVSSALLVPNEATLSATLRQLNQFGYDLDRVQFVAGDEVELLAQVQKNYDQFIQVVTQVVELIRAGKADEARRLQLAEATPLADRLERLTNQLVNRAAADVVASIETNHARYLTSRWVVIGFAVASIVAALVLGYAFSRALIGPVEKIDSNLKQIAAGDFSKRVEVPNLDELGTLGSNLNRMSHELGRLYQQLDAANRHKSQFLANVNHELRTPVSAIIAYGGLVLSETDDQISSVQRENLQDLISNAERLLAMIDSLLEIAKIEAGRMEVRVEPINVEEIIQGATVTIESTLKNTQVQIIRDIAKDLPILNTDPDKLRQIILNLLDNAAKFTEQGEIRISASQQNGALKLMVSDTGIGIPEENLGRVFEEFHRGGSQATEKYRGTGLGLAIVKKLANLLGGQVAVESAVGKGSKFSVILPLKYEGFAPQNPSEVAPT